MSLRRNWNFAQNVSQGDLIQMLLITILILNVIQALASVKIFGNASDTTTERPGSELRPDCHPNQGVTIWTFCPHWVSHVARA
jgi:hypothetical protein